MKLVPVTAYRLPDGTAHPDKMMAVALWLQNITDHDPDTSLTRAQATFLVKNRKDVIALLKELDEHAAHNVAAGQ